ncbi:MAG: hypothetical protein HDR92_08125 [Bacteroides sp.]|nr:hypothetical protein [Bacteroides sp.]
MSKAEVKGEADERETLFTAGRFIRAGKTEGAAAAPTHEIEAIIAVAIKWERFME